MKTWRAKACALAAIILATPLATPRADSGDWILEWASPTGPRIITGAAFPTLQACEADLAVSRQVTEDRVRQGASASPGPEARWQLRRELLIRQRLDTAVCRRR